MSEILKGIELADYLNNGIKNIISEILQHTFKNPKETEFLIKYKMQSKKAEMLRSYWEEKGIHIPAFLISSITHSCNLFCKGCYARENGICGEETNKSTLTDADWESIFRQASEIGIGFNLLAGGEPLVRRNVISIAAKMKDTIFPVFTNGTLIDDFYLDLFDENRNLIPILSLEGTEKTTDDRRGEGIYKQLLQKMNLLKNKNILFGVSVTATTENLSEITSLTFIKTLVNLGCKLVFFIEYVPIDEKTKNLAFSDKERDELKSSQSALRDLFDSVLFLSFPGDEKGMGGCLAAGRGFFHINPYGAAEPCPFSPYSDCSLKDHTLLEALQSSFFKKLNDQKLVGTEHIGGCALFEQEESVKALCEQSVRQG